MTTPTEVTYPTENLIAGKIQTLQVKFAADTYYRGMPLEYDAANDRYQYLNSGDLAGFFMEDVDTTGRAITANAYGSIINGGEIYEGGIVTDANVSYTVTEDLIAAWAVRGFYIKRA